VQPRATTVPGADGLRLRVLEWSAEGTPLVLLHGFGNDAHVWDDLAPTLAPHYRTLAVDLRGHGDSDRDPERRYDYASHVRDLEALTAALGIGRLVLVGHSFGGRVAMLFAGAHPDRMAGLVVVDAGPELDARGTTRIVLDVQQQRERDLTFASAAEYERVLARAYPAARPETLARLAAHGLRRRPDGRLEPKTDPGFHASRGTLSDAERAAFERETTRALWEALARVPCPALVVRGAASDVLDPDVAERMAEEVLPRGRLAVVGRASHSVMLDNPDEFGAVVRAFALGED
jgi:pimeloyl-ACP methyl ester carboxylesterase